MEIGIVLIIMGLICILLPKTQWYKDDIEKHNHTDLSDFIQPIRNMLGWACLIVGIFAILFVLFY